MDRLQAMKVFARVVEEGGFAAAARAMDMSPPVVTRMVAELEQHMAAGGKAKLTLCGERNAVQWQSQPRGLMDRIKSVFGTKRLPDLREML